MQGSCRDVVTDGVPQRAVHISSSCAAPLHPLVVARPTGSQASLVGPVLDTTSGLHGSWDMLSRKPLRGDLSPQRPSLNLASLVPNQLVRRLS